MKMIKRISFRDAGKALTLLVLGGGVFILGSCANSGSLAPAPSEAYFLEESDSNRTVTTKPLASERRVERTGIATGWGREVGSSMNYTDFVRNSATPANVSTIRYNDLEGARSMGVNLRHEGDEMQKTAGGLLEWGMTSGWGGLDNYWWRGGRFVVGKKGREYEIKIKNLSNARMEIVLSVDGLDVIDGKPASTKKRGYIINPRQTLVVKGFRTSHEAVATFKFSSVDGSYANLRHGETRNVGVVGMAVFYEKGATPGAEAVRRGAARAFAEAPLIRARD